MEFVKCIKCGGDGRETCDNPDHGFLSAMSFRGANESACPCCGHDENYKITKYVNGKREYSKCYECEGTGKLILEQANIIAEEIGYDNEFEPC